MTDTDPFEQAKAHFFQGNADFEAGRLEQALARYQAALALMPGRPSVLANLGITQFRLGQWATAATTLETAAQADPSHLDAWLALAHCRLRLEQPAQALQAFDAALAIDPTQAEAWSQRGGLLRDAGRHAEAAHSFEQALAHGADETLNRFYLASVTPQAPVPPQAPLAYVEALFDEYADDFQRHLVEGLNYQAHQTLLAPLLAEARHYPRVLDLGCGTGLCGQLIHPLADAVDGVDVSGAMVVQAQASGAYRQVVHGDLLPFLAATDEEADLVIAADVFIYVGALEAVFAAVRQRLAPGGRFAFSVERSADGSDLVLLPSLRYAHSGAYIERLARACGLKVLRQWAAPLREDQKRPVMGLYAVLERPLSA